MNQTKFKDICEAAARALQTSATERDGRCSLAINDIDVLIDLNEEADTLHCYVDLGDPNLQDRMEVCEQLLALNLHTHSNHHGTYAFEPSSARAIFCAKLHDANNLDGDELAEILRYYLDETAEGRQVVRGFTPMSHSIVFTGELA